MAQEYGALLKWPKDLEKDLGELLGKKAILMLHIVTLEGHDKDNKQVTKEETHEVLVDEKEGKTAYYEEIYNKCFAHINPIKKKFLSGNILSFVSRKD